DLFVPWLLLEPITYLCRFRGRVLSVFELPRALLWITFSFSLRDHFRQLPGDCRERPRHNAQIQPKRRSSSVANVHFDHFVERRFVLPPHLPESGQARQTVESLLLPRQIILIFVRHARPRPPNAHLSPQHVDH